MMPETPVLTMMRRTLRNLAIVERASKHGDGYEVTQLINSFLVAFIHPWEKLRPDICELNLARAALVHPVIKGGPNCIVMPETVGQMLRFVRNSFAHGHVDFSPAVDGSIGAIKLWNVDNSGRVNWRATVTPHDMHRFLIWFCEIIEGTHNIESTVK